MNFGGGGASSGKVPARPQATSSTQQQQAQAAPKRTQKSSNTTPSRQGENSGTSGEFSYITAIALWIFTFAFLVVSIYFFGILCLLCFNRDLLIDWLGCMNDCRLPEKYIGAIFALYLLQVLASLAGVWGITLCISALALTFTVFCGLMVVLGVVFYVLVKDYSLIIGSVFFLPIWFIETLRLRSNHQ